MDSLLLLFSVAVLSIVGLSLWVYRLHENKTRLTAQLEKYSLITSLELERDRLLAEQEKIEISNRERRAVLDNEYEAACRKYDEKRSQMIEQYQEQQTALQREFEEKRSQMISQHQARQLALQREFEEACAKYDAHRLHIIEQNQALRVTLDQEYQSTAASYEQQRAQMLSEFEQARETIERGIAQNCSLDVRKCHDSLRRHTSPSQFPS